MEASAAKSNAETTPLDEPLTIKISGVRPIMEVLSSDSDEDSDSFVVLSPSELQILDSAEDTVDEMPEALTKVKALNKAISEDLMSFHDIYANTPSPQSSEDEVEVGTDEAEAPAEIAPQASYGEIHANVQALISENEMLKEAVSQGNLNMRNYQQRIEEYHARVEEQNSEWREKLLEAKKRIDKLQAECARAGFEMEKHNAIIELQDGSIQELKNKLKQKDESEKKIADLEKQLEIAESRCQEAIKKSVQCQSEVDKYDEKYTELFLSSSDRIDNLTEQIKELEESAARMKKEQDKIDQLYADEIKKNGEVRLELESCKIQLKEVVQARDSTIEVSNDKLKKLKAQCLKTKKASDQFQSEAETYKKKCEDIEKASDAMTKTIKELKVDAVSMKQACDKLLLEFDEEAKKHCETRHELESCKVQLEDSSDRIDNMTKKIKELEESAAGMKAEQEKVYQLYGDEVKSHGEVRLELENCKVQLKKAKIEYKKKNKEHADRINNITEDLKAKEKVIDSRWLKTEKASKQFQAEAETYKKKCEDIEKASTNREDAMTKRIKELETNEVSMKQAYDKLLLEFDEEAKKHGETRRELESCKFQLHDSSDRIDNMTEKIKQLEESAAGMKTEQERVYQLYDDEVKSHGEVRLELESCKVQLKEAGNEHKKLEEEHIVVVEGHHRVVEALNAKLKDLESRCLKAKKASEQFQAEAETHRKKCEDIEIDSTNREDAMIKRIKEYEVSMKQAYDKLLLKFGEEVKKHEEARRELESCKVRLHDSSERIDNMTEKIKQLEESTAGMKAEQERVSQLYDDEVKRHGEVRLELESCKVQLKEAGNEHKKLEEEHIVVVEGHHRVVEALNAKLKDLESRCLKAKKASKQFQAEAETHRKKCEDIEKASTNREDAMTKRMKELEAEEVFRKQSYDDLFVLREEEAKRHGEARRELESCKAQIEEDYCSIQELERKLKEREQIANYDKKKIAHLHKIFHIESLLETRDEGDAFFHRLKIAMNQSKGVDNLEAEHSKLRNKLALLQKEKDTINKLYLEECAQVGNLQKELRKCRGDLEVLREEHVKLQAECLRASCETEKHVTTIKVQDGNIKQLNRKLKEKVEGQNDDKRIIADLHKQLELVESYCQDTVQERDEYQARVQDTLKEHDEYQARVEEWKIEWANRASKAAQAANDKDVRINELKENAVRAKEAEEALLRNLNTCKVQLAEVKSDCTLANSHLELTKENLKVCEAALAEKTEVMKQKYIEEAELHDITRGHLESSKQQILLLEEKIAEVSHQHDCDAEALLDMSHKLSRFQGLETLLASCEAAQEELEETRDQVRSTQQTVVGLEAALQERDEALAVAQKEIAECRERAERLTKEKADKLFALKTQLEINKNDYDRMEEAKNSFKQERDQIASDLENLRRRNEQLQDEVELLREHPGIVSVASPPEPHQTEYKCPKCSFGFTTYQALDNHVQRCLELDGFP